MSAAHKKFGAPVRSATARRASFLGLCNQIAAAIERRKKLFWSVFGGALTLWAILFAVLPKIFVARAFIAIPEQAGGDAFDAVTTAHYVRTNLQSLAQTLAKKHSVRTALMMACFEEQNGRSDEIGGCDGLARDPDAGRDRIVADISVRADQKAVAISYPGPTSDRARALVELFAEEIATALAQSGAGPDKALRKIANPSRETAVADGPFAFSNEAKEKQPPNAREDAPDKPKPAQPAPFVASVEASSLPNFPRPVPFAAAGLALALVCAFLALVALENPFRALRAARSEKSNKKSGDKKISQPPLLKRPRQARLRTPPDEDADWAEEIIRRQIFLALFAPAQNADGARKVRRLAMDLAASGASVLVVDCDFESPSVHEIFKIASQPGLGDVAARRVHPQDAIHAPKGLEAFVMPAGECDDQDEEIFRGAGVADLLRWARRFDHVLALCPEFSRARTDLLHVEDAQWIVLCDEKPQRKLRKINLRRPHSSHSPKPAR